MLRNQATRIAHYALAALLLSLGNLAHAAPLSVAVVANLKYAFDDLVTEFRQEGGCEVQGVFASAGKITSQIRNGAPYDVFVSADTEFPDTLYRDGLATAPARIYAYGVLVLWTTRELDMNQGMTMLASPQVGKIAIANPAVGIYGRAAMQAIENNGLSAVAAPKLVLGDTITQAAQYVDSGAADIGFVAKSIVVAPEMQGKGHWIEVPKGSYDPIAQGMVILKHGEETQATNARRFVAFLQSAQARAIFTKYGYLLP